MNPNLNKFKNIYQKDLTKFKKSYKFIVEDNEKEITIKCEDYKKRIDLNNLKIITNNKFNNISDIYNCIINSFENNKVFIKEILKDKMIKLEMNINIKNKAKNIEIILLYDEGINKKNLIKKKRNENTINISNNNSKKDDLNSKPYNLDFYYNIIEESHHYLTDQIIIFKNIFEELYLFCTKDGEKIIIYNLIDNKRVSEIKNAHKDFQINDIDHYSEMKNQIDLGLTVSKSQIKLWNINNLECILDIKETKDYKSKCRFFNYKNQCFFIILSSINCQDFLNVYDLKGEKIRTINVKDATYLNIYYDKKITNKNYIIYCGSNDVISYDYEKNKIYRNYANSYDKDYNHLAVYKSKDKLIKLFGCNDNSFIKIWNFHSGKLLEEIKVSPSPFKLINVCLWDDNYLFVACEFHSFKLIDLNTKTIVGAFNQDGKVSDVKVIKKLDHPKFGECLITLSFNEISLWINKNKI